MGLYTALFVLFLLSTPLAHALDTEITRRSLRGLKGVEVTIENLPPDVEQNGLTVSVIRTDVELKLRQAGIPVLPASPGTATPYLYVNVSATLDRDRGIWAFVIRAELKQDAVSVRDPSVLLPGVTTWDVGTVGGVTKQSFRTLMRDDVKDLVDQFLNAYLSVNPKK
jgi:hypothetical protein